MLNETRSVRSWWWCIVRFYDTVRCRWEWWHMHVFHYVKTFRTNEGTFCLDWIRYWHKETFIWQDPIHASSWHPLGRCTISLCPCDPREMKCGNYTRMLSTKTTTVLMLGQLVRMAHSMLPVHSHAFVGILVKLDWKYLLPFSSCVRDHMVRHLQLMLHIWNDFDHKTNTTDTWQKRICHDCLVSHKYSSYWTFVSLQIIETVLLKV